MKRLSLTRYRHQAAILLKEIRYGNPEALQRIQQLDLFSSSDLSDLPHLVKLKHCLNVMALEQGFRQWADFTSDFETSVMDELAARYSAGYLNHWYASYDEAKRLLEESRESPQRYLLPYKKGRQSQYYICEAAYIRSFGLDPDAREWEAIGYDLVQPRDRKARLSLLDSWVEGQFSKPITQPANRRREVRS
ncbi:hypothetical protein [Hahella ganghwensis]|uniref:hypothetical protein n=1 Tax=Hahella ganghwensis TaxID=286420 RepID=UPI0003619318|nr:hypothetical protein [Hahella ganghwensis]